MALGEGRDEQGATGPEPSPWDLGVSSGHVRQEGGMSRGAGEVGGRGRRVASASLWVRVTDGRVSSGAPCGMWALKDEWGVAGRGGRKERS